VNTSLVALATVRTLAVSEPITTHATWRSRELRVGRSVMDLLSGQATLLGCVLLASELNIQG
jgi:hypothetical protein